MRPIIDFLNFLSLRIKKADNNNKTYIKYSDGIPIVLDTFPWNIKKVLLSVCAKTFLLHINVRTINI